MHDVWQMYILQIGRRNVEIVIMHFDFEAFQRGVSSK
jgi:hypothetical protein